MKGNSDVLTIGRGELERPDFGGEQGQRWVYAVRCSSAPGVVRHRGEAAAKQLVVVFPVEVLSCFGRGPVRRIKQPCTLLWLRRWWCYASRPARQGVGRGKQQRVVGGGLCSKVCEGARALSFIGRQEAWEIWKRHAHLGQSQWVVSLHGFTC
jgi:hypothetical protein